MRFQFNPLTGELDLVGNTSTDTTSDNGLINDQACDSSVAVGDWVYIDASFIAQKAIATSEATSNVIGVVEAKTSSTLCDIRVVGITGAIFSSLDPTAIYFLSSSSAGLMTTVPPSSGTGYVIVYLGEPTTDMKFSVNIKTRIIRSL